MGKQVITLVSGSYTYPDQSSYHGEWNLSGEKHGYGKLILADGTTYLGKFERDLFSGLGFLQFPDGAYYIGQFMSGWFHGQGVYRSASGTRFEGYFRAGKIYGIGRTTFSNGSNGEPPHIGFHREWKFIEPNNCADIVENVQRMCRLFRIECQTPSRDDYNIKESFL